LSDKKKIFIIGGSGFIGSRVVRLLVKLGYVPRCLLRTTSKTNRIANLPIENVTGDVMDPAAVAEGVKGTIGSIHLASPSSWDDIDSPLMKEVVEKGTRNVLDAARAAGQEHRVVFVSSAVAINGSDKPQIFDETSPFTLDDRRLSYCRHKRAAETLCLESGIPVVIVNPTEVYGPEDTALITAGNLKDFANSSPVMVCDGGTSVVHVEDVAQGIVRAFERGRTGERYILGGENLTIRQLAETTLSILGKQKRIVQLPNAMIRALASVGKLTHIPLPFNPEVIPYATRYWFVDSAKAERELDMSFRPALETLAPKLRWLREVGHIT
jgi:dihydroflavonol-4-reductase